MRAPPGFGEFYSELGRAVAFHPTLVKVTGSVTATLFLDQFLYWTPRTSEAADGWVYKTQAEIQEETGLSRFEQETARRKLRERGVLQEQRAGVPAKLFFRVDLDALSRLWEVTYPMDIDSQDAEIPQSRKGNHSMLDSTTPHSGKSSSNKQGIPHSLKERTETTKQKTTNTKARGSGGGLNSKNLEEQEATVRQQLQDRGFSNAIVKAVLDEIRLTSADREISYPLRYALKTASRIRAEANSAGAQLKAAEARYAETTISAPSTDPAIEEAIAALSARQKRTLRKQAEQQLPAIARGLEPAVQAAMRELYRKRLEGVA